MTLDEIPELPAGKTPRSDTEPIAEGFTKEEADLSERMSYALNSGCQTYWPSPYAVCGEIRNKYNAMGGPASFLSFPKSPEYQNPGATGFRSEFINGSIYWSPSTGAHPVTLLYMSKWAEHDWETGFLGYPTNDEIGNNDGQGSHQDFQGAGIYWHPIHSPLTAAIGGAIRAKWDAVGAESGLLGYPTIDEQKLPDGQGRMNRFQHGVLYWHPTTGAYPVTGTILAQWAFAGYEMSQFGYPSGDQVNQGSMATEQKFQNSKIYAPSITVPIGDTGVSLSLGVLSPSSLSAGSVTDGVRFSGPGFEVTFQADVLGNINFDYLRTSTLAPNQLKLIAGLPAGYSMVAGTSSLSIKNSSGTRVGSMALPLTFDGNGAAVSTNTTLSGGEINIDLGTSTALPIRTFAKAENAYNIGHSGYDSMAPAERAVCNSNLTECWNVRDAGPDAQQVSYREYPNYKQLGEQDNRVDAVRHCAWLGYMTQRADKDFAWDMGIAHELSYQGGEMPQAMDLYNNKTGIAVGLREEHSTTGIEVTCREYGRVARKVVAFEDIGPNTHENDLIYFKD